MSKTIHNRPWYCCPHCGRALFPVRANTKLQNMPFRCKACKHDPEFLQNFKVGNAPLPKEVVDAVLAENGRDIEAAKKPFADCESIKAQLATAAEGLKAFEGVDVKGLQGQVFCCVLSRRI